MKILVEHCDLPENEVVLRCRAVDDEMLRVLTLLNSQTQRLCVFDDAHELTLLSPADVLYCESVEEKTFVYLLDTVHQSALSLAELAGRYELTGFFRIGKSALVNLHRIAHLKPLPAGRIEATLQNNEKLIVSRHYAPLLRRKLEI